MDSEYRSIYKEKSTGKEVRVKRLVPGQYSILLEDNTTIKVNQNQLRDEYKYVRHAKPQVNYGSSFL